MKVIRDAVPQTADPSDAAWDKSIGKYRCSECLEEVPAVTRIDVRHHLAPFQLCDRCLAHLRKLIAPPGAARARLSARSYRALWFLAQNPLQRGSWGEVREAAGTYATNVVKALIARGLVRVVALIPGDPLAGELLELTPAGRERLQA